MLIDHEDLLLVDTRPFAEYSMGHIQGAVNIDLFQFHWLDTSKVGIKQFEQQSRILLSNIGVRKKNLLCSMIISLACHPQRCLAIALFFPQECILTRWRIR